MAWYKPVFYICVRMALFTKTSASYTYEQECANIAIVAGLPFVPAQLSAANGCVTATRGVDLFVALTTASTPQDVCALAVAAFSALDALHAANCIHLDAKAANFIVCAGTRSGGANVVGSGAPRHVCLIDFETLWYPDAKARKRQLFNAESALLTEYGRRPYAAYESMPREVRAKYDVHTFCASLLARLPSTNTTRRLLSACTVVLGHTPVVVAGVSASGKLTKYTEYLVDATKPVMNARRAIEAVTKALEAEPRQPSYSDAVATKHAPLYAVR